MEEFLQVGVITATHGIHGEVKVFPTTDDPKTGTGSGRCQVFQKYGYPEV